MRRRYGDGALRLINRGVRHKAQLRYGEEGGYGVVGLCGVKKPAG